MSAPEPSAEPCDHEFEVVDDSFDHEFGTEICICIRCKKCGKEEPYEPYRGPENE